MTQRTYNKIDLQIAWRKQLREHIAKHILDGSVELAAWLNFETKALADGTLAKLNRKAVCDEWLNKKPSAEVVEAFGE